ncbi:hypothetical protein IU449_16895 [Nocardia higoensis]|uniref:Lipoprotein n=1 Tax=Nocardia higoensis TaxID=228599 RepID=A0ABS0DCK5_9NOCA|nr:hypothetical protein [Nocardia higoensis]MBF6356199.1 hypothetical protein [Nocardia higoensis]
MPSDRFFRTRGRALLAVASIALLTGCGQTVGGHATARVVPVDPATLETGPYPIEPAAYEPEFDDKEQVFEIESRRMLGYLVPPFDIDPELSHLDRLELVSAGEGLYGEGYDAAYPAEFKPIVDRHHLISGVMTIRSNNSVRASKNAVHSLLRFPSDQTAGAAASDFATAMHTIEPALRKIAVPGHTGIEVSTADDKKGYLFLARGSFVVLTMLTMPTPDAGALAEQAAALLDRQFERLESATATPVDEILDLPLDPDGIMRRTLPQVGGEYLTGRQFSGPLSPAAQLHFERDGAALSEAFENAGVDLVARNYAVLYRTRDQQASFRLHTALTRLDRDDEDIDPPPGLEDAARCRVLAERDPVTDFTTVCVLLHDRYVAVVGSSESLARGLDPGLYQRAAAQYSILARSE